MAGGKRCRKKATRVGYDAEFAKQWSDSFLDECWLVIRLERGSSAWTSGMKTMSEIKDWQKDNDRMKDIEIKQQSSYVFVKKAAVLSRSHPHLIRPLILMSRNTS